MWGWGFAAGCWSSSAFYSWITQPAPGCVVEDTPKGVAVRLFNAYNCTFGLYATDLRLRNTTGAVEWKSAFGPDVRVENEESIPLGRFESGNRQYIAKETRASSSVYFYPANGDMDSDNLRVWAKL